MIRVLLVDDHRALSEGISAALQQTGDITVTAQMTDGNAALEHLSKTASLPDVVITDLEMKGMNGLVLLQHLVKKYPEIRVVILTQHEDYSVRAFQEGAKAYILKESGIDEIVLAIRAVAAGQLYPDPFLTILPKTPAIATLPEFTTRELQIIRLIADEFTTRQIAEKLNLPFSAVETYTRNIRRKTGSSNIAGIVKFALQNNLCG